MTLLPPAAVLLDIEGTATSRDFVEGVMRPFADGRMAAFIAQRHEMPEVREVLAEIRALVPGQAPSETIAHWLAHDPVVDPLQALRALIWHDAFASGALRVSLYPDVAPALRRWNKAGVRLATYSADAASLQRELFANAPEGDLAGLFVRLFDTHVGLKSEPENFGRLAIALAVPTAEVAYLSAFEAELDAAAAAGMRTCQIIRPESGVAPSARHDRAIDLPAAASMLGMPAAA